MFLLLFALALPEFSGLPLEFTNLKAARGKLYIAIYDREEAFMQAEKAAAQYVLPVEKAGSLDLHAAGLKPGIYAISCFHDVNGNGKLDVNLLGIPTEPYGFSNNARPKFRAPSWSESKFEWKNDGGRFSIRLEKW